jgi:pimeloyl-ACP methyl ester carboxylesterase
MNNQREKSYKIVSINGVKISYLHRPRLGKGPKVSIIFLSGYKSDMLGTKATFLDTLSKKIGYEYLRFDYSGHGSSEGKIEKQLLSDWVNESYFLIKKKLNHPVIIVGSSLGGWIAFILLKKFKKNILGVIGIGAAPDFTNNIIENLSSIKKKRYMDKGYISIKSDYGEKPYKFTKKFIEDSKKNFILLKNLEINTKITLLYGLQDSAVKLKTQIDLLKLLKTKNAKLTILNNSDHRMSSSLDLNLLEQTIKNMIKGTP